MSALNAELITIDNGIQTVRDIHHKRSIVIQAMMPGDFPEFPPAVYIPTPQRLAAGSAPANGARDPVLAIMGNMALGNVASPTAGIPVPATATAATAPVNGTISTMATGTAPVPTATTVATTPVTTRVRQIVQTAPGPTRTRGGKGKGQASAPRPRRGIIARLSPRSKFKKEITLEDRKNITNVLLSQMYELGTVPHQQEPDGSYRHLFDHGNIMDSIETLLEENPGWDVFVYMEADSLMLHGGFCQFASFHALVVPHGEHPPKWLNTSNGEDYVPFKQLSLDWVNIGDLKDKDKLLKSWSDTTLHKRAFILHCTSRRLRYIDDETKANYTKRNMLDCRSSKFPPAELAGMLQLPFEIDGVKLTTEISLSSTVSENVQFVVDEFDDEGVEVDGNGRAHIKTLIKKAIQQKWKTIEDVAWVINGRHDMTKVDKIFAAKIYPVNMTVAVPQAVRVAKSMQLNQMAARDGSASVVQAQEVAAMEHGLEDYQFQAPLEIGAYGPKVRRIFAGPEYVQEDPNI
uniref:Uncharacterized protein n=1 Tax=Amphora coffeiformis TaxID=265554 RepID=A0A7S3NZS3_9STRA|mmetsp:Transcript_10423/g.19986  ORF Transcript_10423/g.19986 Transcript_10423/m.19986 type:complete len:518 (+) Transcript_10423:581-2134(+)